MTSLRDKIDKVLNIFVIASCIYILRSIKLVPLQVVVALNNLHTKSCISLTAPMGYVAQRVPVAPVKVAAASRNGFQELKLV